MAALVLRSMIVFRIGHLHCSFNAKDCVRRTLSEHDLHVLRTFYEKLTELSRQEHDLSTSHSVEEARSRHATKMSGRR